MKIRTMALLILCFLSTAVFSEEISITLKPTKSLTGTKSVNIHENGKVTLLVYESPSKITENLLNINPAAVNNLKKMAINTQNEYMLLKKISPIKTYKLLAGITVARELVTKSISSRRLTQSMIKLIGNINSHLPEEHRVKIVVK